MENPGLDYAEMKLLHPIQSGEFRPVGDFILWIPTSDEIEIGSPKSSIIPDTSMPMRLDVAESSIDVWNELSESWIKERGDNPDINHKYIILPEVLRLLEAKKGERILDFACGEGMLCRMLSNTGAIVTGIDPSAMIDFAVEMEKEDQAGIQYIKSDSLEECGDRYFDKIICNMALMDIEKVDSIFKEFSRILQPGGRLVFSILHPCFNIPTLQPFKIPWDSERNEDRIFVVDNYFDNRVAKYRKFNGVTQYFHRTISQYVKLCTTNNFIIDEISEPHELSEDIIESSPRDLYLEFDRIAKFMVFSLRKELPSHRKEIKNQKNSNKP